MPTRKKLSDDILSEEILSEEILSEEILSEDISELSNSEENFENTLVDIKETSEELNKSISDFLGSSETEEIACVPEQWILNLNIKHCKKCCLPFSVDLAGNYQCENNIPDCPTIKK